MSPTDGRHPPAPPPRLAVRLDRSGRMAHHGAGTLTSANRGSPGHGTEFGARRFISRGSVQGDSYQGVRCKAIHITGFGAGQFMSQCSEQDGSAVWSHLARSEAEPLPVMATGPCVRRGPTRALNSGEDISLWPLGCHPCPAPPDRKKDGSRGGVVVVPE